MVKRLAVASALSLAVVAFGAPAPAQMMSKACKGDIEKFCAKVEKGQGRILKCLREHSKELTAECKTALENQGKAARARRAKRTPPAKRQAKRRICNADFEKYCKGTKGNERLECVRKHKADFSPECQKRVESLLQQLEQKKTSKDSKS